MRTLWLPDGGICVGFALWHCVVVSIEMMPGIVGFTLLACVPLNLASWPA